MYGYVCIDVNTYVYIHVYACLTCVVDALLSCVGPVTLNNTNLWKATRNPTRGLQAKRRPSWRFTGCVNLWGWRPGYQRRYILEGPSTQYLRFLLPKTILFYGFETRDLEYGVLGPSGYGPHSLVVKSPKLG